MKYFIFKTIAAISVSLSISAFAAESAAKYSVDLKALEAQLYPAAVTTPAFTNIVLPLEAFLIQGIPTRNSNLFASDEVLTLKSSKGNRLYHISANAKDLLAYLAENKYTIKIVTGLEADTAKQALDLITLPRLKNIPASKVATLGSMDWTEKVNAKDFGPVGKTLVVSYKGMTVTPADQVIDSGPYYFVYPSYEEMNSNRSSDPQYAEFFAPDENAWRSESLKIARVLFILKQANVESKTVFLSKLAELKKMSDIQKGNIGAEMAAGQFQRLNFQWTFDSKKSTVTACQVVDSMTGKVLQAASLDDCAAARGAVAKFSFDEKTKRATACELRTKDSKYLIRSETTVTRCLTGVKEIKYAIDFESKKCSAFNQKNILLAVMDDNSQCDGKNFIVYVDQEKDWYAFASFKGMEDLSKAQLIKKVIYDWDPRSPLKYPTSFHSMFASEGDNLVKSSFGASCANAVKNFIKSGKNFYSKELLKRTIKISEFPRDDVKDLDFYHYSRSAELGNVAKRKAFGEIYSYLRERCQDKYGNCMGGWFLYMASESESSHREAYGPYGFKITLRRDANILMLLKSSGEGPSFFYDLMKDVENELIAKDSGLQACHGRMANVDIPVTPSVLEALAAEASHVDAYAYFGLNNWAAMEADRGYQWMTVVGPWAIKTMTPIN